MPKPRVLVTPEISRRRGRHLDILREAGFDIHIPADAAPINQTPGLIAELRGCSAALAGMEPYNAATIAGLTGLRNIARVGVGWDAVEIPAATAAGIAVTITPGTNEHSVAELAIALITGVFRGFPARDRNVRLGRWIRQALPRLSGKTLGLVGFGRIGKALAPRAQGLGLKVLAADPYADPAAASKLGVTMLPLVDLLATADIISLHVPSTPETRNMINAESLATMKRGVVLINTSRGTLVDEPALAEALKSGQVWAAGLDVFQEEPVPVSNPLLALENVLVTPHTGGIDEESEYAMCTMAAQCVADLYGGKWPVECIVNGKELGVGWKW